MWLGLCFGGWLCAYVFSCVFLGCVFCCLLCSYFFVSCSFVVVSCFLLGLQGLLRFSLFSSI